MSGAICLAAAAQGNSVAWVSPTFKQSRPLWRWCERTCGGVPGVDISRSERSITFAGGGMLGIYSADSPDTLRGNAFHLVTIDEAARVAEEVWTDAIQPTLADYDGDAILISTPRGKNWFYREFVAAKDDGRLRADSVRAAFTAPSSANPNPNIRAAAELARERVPERTYRQEWLAEFIDDGGLVFRRVRDCATSTPLERGQDGRMYVFGVDWGRSEDYTVIQVFDVAAKRHVFQDRFSRIDYALQRQRLAGLVERFKPRAIIAEENAMGAPIIEQLQRDGLPVRPFTATNATKTVIIESLALAFEQGAIAILPDPILLRELEDYESDRLPSGLVRYSAPSGAHDDCVMALALAWSACTRPPQNYGF